MNKKRWNRGGGMGVFFVRKKKKKGKKSLARGGMKVQHLPGKWRKKKRKRTSYG